MCLLMSVKIYYGKPIFEEKLYLIAFLLSIKKVLKVAADSDLLRQADILGVFVHKEKKSHMNIYNYICPKG